MWQVRAAFLGVLMCGALSGVGVSQDDAPGTTEPTLAVPAEGPAVETPLDPEIAEELRNLAAADFKSREAASKSLLARQGAVVEPLRRLAETGTGEASVRAFDLLRQIYLSGDAETSEVTDVVIEELSGSDDPTVAGRAESVLEACGPVRRLKAIAAFRKAGGIIRFRAPNRGDPVDDAQGMIEYAMIEKSWKGGDEGLKYLRRIEDFRTQFEYGRAAVFAIRGSNLSEQAIVDLETAVPGLNVQRRGPACFGISAYSGFGGDGLLISSVKEGSAADRAGLAPNDIVLKFDGHDVPDFPALVDRISERQPGDKVPVLYSRAGIEKAATVELRGWTD